MLAIVPLFSGFEAEDCYKGESAFTVRETKQAANAIECRFADR
jgi:hypothetical protein